MPFGFALLDPENVVCWHNDRFARLMGGDPSLSLTGSACDRLWRDSDAGDFRAFAASLWSRRIEEQDWVLRPRTARAIDDLRVLGRVVDDGLGHAYLLLTVKPWLLLAMLNPCDQDGTAMARDSEATMILGAAEELGQCTILAANRQADSRIGDGCGALPGRRLQDLPDTALPATLRRNAEAAFRAGEPFSAMYTAGLTGERFALVQWDLWPVNRQNGRITHWLDRRRTAQGAPERMSEDVRWLQLAGDALKATDVGVWHWDLRNGEITFSPRLMRQLGHDISKITDMPAFAESLYHPDDIPKLRQSIDEGIAGSGRFTYVARLRDHGGRYHWISVRGQVIFDADGAPTRLFGTENDVTEETLMRERLLRAERIAMIGNWSMNLSPPGMNWSPECYRLFGVDPDSFRPSALQMGNLIHPEDKVLWQDALKRTLREGRPNNGCFDRFRARIIRADGEIRSCELNAILECDGQGQITGLVGTIQDITATIETEKRLVQAQKMEVVGQMAGGMAHDFNNLLAIIMGNLELLEESTDPEDASDLIATAIDAAQKGASLTQNLLSFARKATLEPTRIDLGGLIADLTKMLRRVLPETIEVQTTSARDTWPVHADRNSFENALLNLAINARDAMNGSGRLTITTENVELEEPWYQEGQEDLVPGLYTVVAVADTGSGMTRDQLAKVFTPFYTTKPPSKGSGLGLPMVQGFAKQSGGSVRVYSEPGIGTTVRLYLPASDTAAIQAARSADPVEPEERLTGRVLLVEDDPGVNRVLTLRLERMGLSVVAAASGDEALQLFQSAAPFDLLLTDIVMPGDLQGPVLAERLRDYAPDLRVVFMSGYPNEESSHGHRVRPDDVSLMKPIGRRDLARALHQALSRPSVLFRQAGARDALGRGDLSAAPGG